MRVPTILIDEAARRLGCTRRTVYSRITAGVFRVIRVRASQRVYVEDVEREITQVAQQGGRCAVRTR